MKGASWLPVVPAVTVLVLCGACGGGSSETSLWSKNTSAAAIVFDPPPSVARVVMNGTGMGMIVWNDGRKLWQQTYEPDVGWSITDRITKRKKYVTGFDVALLGDDGAIVWVEDEQKLLARNWRHGEGWGSDSMELDEQPVGVDIHSPQLAANVFTTHTRIYAVWEHDVTDSQKIIPPEHQVLGTWQHAGAGWVTPVARLDTDNTGQDDPIDSVCVATGGWGNAAVVWRQGFQTSMTPGIHFAWNSNPWDPAETMTTTVPTFGTADVAMDAGGNVTVVWADGEELFARQYSSQLDFWYAPTPIQNQILDPWHAQVVVDEEGNGVAVWLGTLGDYGNIYAARRESATWQAKQVIDARLGVTGVFAHRDTARPKAAIDSHGNIRVIWADEEDIIAVKYDAATHQWDFAEIIGQGRDPDIAMDQSGRAIAVWWNNGPIKRVWEPAAAPPPPPASGQIIFASDRDGDLELYRMDPDGGNVVQMTHNTFSDFDPVWSPDRSQVAFLSNRDGQAAGTHDLYVLNVATGDVERWTNFAADGGNILNPAWSPVDDWIAYTLVWPGGYGGINLVTPDGSLGKELTTNGGDDTPAWSPDGSEIAFSRGGDLYLLDPAGDNSQVPTLLLDEAFDALAPAYSPSGTMIAFQAGGTTTGIQCLTIASGTVVELTDGLDSHPCWSPSGDHLAFGRPETITNTYVCTMEDDGSSEAQVPGQSGFNEQPDWK